MLWQGAVITEKKKNCCKNTDERRELVIHFVILLKKKKKKFISLTIYKWNYLSSLFSETAGCLSNQRYIKPPIIRLSTNQVYTKWLIFFIYMGIIFPFDCEQTYTSIPSSSSQIGPNYQRKSIVHRHVSPHPPLLRQGIVETDTFKSARKTRSMVFPKSVTFF